MSMSASLGWKERFPISSMSCTASLMPLVIVWIGSNSGKKSSSALSTTTQDGKKNSSALSTTRHALSITSQNVLSEMKDKYNAMVERHNAMVDQVQKAAAPQPAPDASKPAVKKPPAKPGFKPKIVPNGDPDKRPPPAA